MKKIAAIIAGFAISMAAQAAPVYNGANGHYYDYVTSGPNFTFAQALAHAATQTLFGQTGYVATVTSLAEQQFIVNNVTHNTAWIGASDAAQEGVFRWMNGPEVGQVLGFTYWSAGEPNNCCNGEDQVVINWGANGSWNDIGLPSFPDYRVGYVIEYVPEPGSLSLAALALLGAGVARRRKPA